MLGSATRRDGVTDWFASLTPGTITALVLLLAGLLALVTGLIGLIRRAQRRLSEDRWRHRTAVVRAPEPPPFHARVPMRAPRPRAEICQLRRRSQP
jgi:hypothetical protein